MADEPISALTLFTSYSTADEVEILDVSDTTFAATGTNKRIQFSTLLSMAGVGSGGLTSVGLSAPSWLTVSNSPLTANGTLNVTATTGEMANEFLATPSWTTGAVGLRAITTTDLPSAVVLTTGTYASPAWLTAISGGIVSGNIAGSATSDVTLAPGSSTRNVIQPTADFKPLILKGSSGQSSNLQEWQNNSGTALASMDASGNFQDSPYTASKAFTIIFANGVANQKADLYMTGTQMLTGYLDVALSSTFQFGNAGGVLVSVRRKMHLSLIFLEFLSEMDLEVLGLPSKISAERAVLRVLSEESSRECPMRIAFDPQRRFDCPPVLEVRLNTSCRDEIIPILKGLQHIYSQPELRDELLDAVAQDVNGTSSADLGRPGMTYWSILVLGAVRLGCNFDYDRLQNLAEEHRSLRQVMGIGGWCDDPTFDWRCLRDNICLLSPDTIERVNHLIVAEGHRLVPEAAETVRGDSFVPATNIHYPTDSSLIGDGLRTIVPLAVRLARLLGLGGWRQRKHLLRTVKKQLRAINKIAKGKGRDFPKRLQDGYRTLLDLADRILARALELLDPALISIAPSAAASRINMLKEKLTDYLNMTIHVCDLARRRVLEGERIDNSEKLFSLFEPHTELIIRGKVPQPLEFGHRVLVIEDGAGFVCHYAILPRGAEDSEVLVEEMKQAQQRLNGRIRRASFDRGFHSPENQRELVKLVEQPCLPKPGHVQAQRQEQEATVEFRQARRRHPGIESAIGALQSGNGLDRCRDKTFGGYCRYVGLGILGRNLQVLGKLLIGRGAEVRGGAVAARPHRGLSWSARPQRRGGTMASTPW